MKAINILYFFFSFFIASTIAAISTFDKKDIALIKINRINEFELILNINPQQDYIIYKNSLKLKQKVSNNFIPFVLSIDKKLSNHINQSFVARAFLPRNVKNTELILVLELQCCSKTEKICYPPIKRFFYLEKSENLAIEIFNNTKELKNNSKMNFLLNFWKKISFLLNFWKKRNDINYIENMIQDIKIYYLFPFFFLFGVSLSFTPCMLPMFPILSAIILSKYQSSRSMNKYKKLNLCFFYVLGMATIYSIIGICIARFGSKLYAWLQHPIFLIIFAIFLTIIALSLFGLYELKLPSKWTNYLDKVLQSRKKNGIKEIFIFGCISSLVISPCVTPAFAGILSLISQTHSITLGGILLFSMGFGMGLPLFLSSIGLRSTLLRSHYLISIFIKKILGVVIILLAIWTILPIFQKQSEKTMSLNNGLVFHTVDSITILDERLRYAKKNNKKVLLDFYASWCISCIEIEKTVLNHPNVAFNLSTYELIKIDITHFSKDSQSILERYNLFGPPAILFLNENGEEIQKKRIIGSLTVENFLKKISSS